MNARLAGLLCGLLGTTMAATPAAAQSPVTIVTSFGAGSAADIGARLLAAEFSPVFGVPFVVKNVTGAAGTIAALEAIRARPDGNSLLFTPIGPIAIQPNFMRNLAYTARDVLPICQLNEAWLVMMTPQNSGLRTLRDVIARAREAGGNMPFATTGPGTTPHISMVTWARLAGVQMTHISYRGPGDVMVAFQTGDVQLMNDHPSSVRPNNLHPIAVLAPTRMAEFPDAPTLRESGFDLTMSIWHGLFAPVGTPAPVIARLEAACEAASRSPAVIQGHERIQAPIAYLGAQAFAAKVTADVEAMRQRIEAGGLRAAE
jgi:tripartite-type tricarboxylate transporter receptor subunit TctC